MNKKRRALNTCFFVYCILLVFILILRSEITFPNDLEAVKERLGGSANLIPFRTIDNYIKAYRHGNISLSLLRANIIGNLLLFFPMGAFLPAVFKSCRKLPTALISLTLMIVLVEVLQLFLGVGRLDIDDLILNLTGALAGWIIYSIFKEIKKLRWR